ncbi:MAG: cytoplasmic protein [Planctomycetes bacterium]|nr:cytoplasmic protein [Planctomycetota bacterium]
MAAIAPERLEALIRQQLDVFYARRVQALSRLNLKDTLRRKNPYLFRAIGVQKASEIVEQVLQAFMSSSDEGIFGDAFFEPVAKEVCGGVAAGGAGVDVVIETPNEYTVLSVKSGPNWGNSSQMRKLQDDFNTARSVFLNKKLRKHFRALLGHCYGRKSGEPNAKRSYSVRSGQAFWEEITGDPDFYLKLIGFMKDHPVQHRIEFEKAWNQAVNRFTAEFLKDFATAEGVIDWEKIVAFKSGERRQAKDDSGTSDGPADAA